MARAIHGWPGSAVGPEHSQANNGSAVGPEHSQANHGSADGLGPRLAPNSSGPLVPTNYTFNVILDLASVCDVDWWGRGLLAGVVHLISLELSHIAGPTDAQVVWYVEFKGVPPACLEAGEPLL